MRGIVVSLNVGWEAKLGRMGGWVGRGNNALLGHMQGSRYGGVDCF